MLSHHKGFTRTIFLIVVVVIILGVFGFDLRAIIESPQVQENLGYVWGIVVHVWENYLAAPVIFVWNLFIDYVVEPSIEFLRGNQSLEEMPSVQ